MDNLNHALPLGKREPLRWLFAFAGGVALFSLAYFFVVEPLLVAAYQQRGPSWLNQLFASRSNRPLTDLVNVCRIYYSRSLMIFCFALSAVAAWRHRDAVRRGWNAFINEPGSAINLAVFRIAVFATLFFLANPKTVELFSSFPIELQKLPSPGGNVLRLFPWNPEAALFATYLLKTVCVLGIVGVGSRLCAFSATCLAFYVLGFQQSFGKVDHFHHLIWFTLLLAVSRLWRCFVDRCPVCPTTEFLVCTLVGTTTIGRLRFATTLRLAVVRGDLFLSGILEVLELRIRLGLSRKPAIAFVLQMDISGRLAASVSIRPVSSVIDFGGIGNFPV